VPIPESTLKAVAVEEAEVEADAVVVVVVEVEETNGWIWIEHPICFLSPVITLVHTYITIFLSFSFAVNTAHFLSLQPSPVAQCFHRKAS
jgi:hypothetical protein